MNTKANRTTLALVAVLALVIVTVLGGLIFKITRSGSDAEATNPVSLAAESFPVPPGTTVALPPATGVLPPSATRNWHATGTLEEACNQWRELFRGWVDQAQQRDVGGEVIPGVSCSFTGTKNGFDAKLRIASYAGAPPDAILIVTGS